MFSVGFVEAQINSRHVEKIDFRFVPDTVFTAFHKFVKGGENISWEHEHITQAAGPAYEFYNSSFEQNGRPCHASFDRAGELMDFQIQARLDTLPNVVKLTVSKEFGKVQRKHQQAALTICALGSSGDETIYSIDFYRSPEDRLAWIVFQNFAVDIKGQIIKKDKNHRADWR